LKLFDKEYKTDRATCPLCHKVTSKSQLSRHKKLCKAKHHKQEQISQEIQVEPEITKEDLKAEIKQLKLQLEKLEQQFAGSQASTSRTINNNTTNRNDNTHNFTENETKHKNTKLNNSGQEFFMTPLSQPKQDVLSLTEIIDYNQDGYDEDILCEHTPLEEVVTATMFEQFKNETVIILKQQQDTIDSLEKQLEQCFQKNTIHQKQSQIMVVTSQPSTSNIIQNSVTKSNKKKVINHAMRIVCWNTYIGEDIGKTLCLCCKSNSITQHNFHCGHVVAEAHGGMMHVNNLRPICAVCNNSMGTINMQVFAKENFDVEI
jgi:hypothetical protein